MAPSLRANTKGRTEASAKAAAEAKARYKKRPRNEFYPSNKGLVKFYMTQKLNAMYVCTLTQDYATQANTTAKHTRERG